jgi:hypothetical protein
VRVGGDDNGSSDGGRVTTDAGTLQSPRKVLREGAAMAAVARRSGRMDRAIMMRYLEREERYR